MREKKVKIYFMLHLLFIILPFFSCSFENENKEKFSIMTWNVFLNKGDSNACFEILNNQKSDFYIFLAKKYNLLISGGSDFHGPLVKPDIEIGHGKNRNINIKKLSLVDEIEKRNNGE